MNRVSKAFYMVSILGGAILSGVIAAVGGAMSANVTDPSQLGPIFGVLALSAIPGLYAFIVSLVLLYKCWAQIQDGHASTTPGLAVGLLFIPIFNLYWNFRAFYSYAKDYNAFLERHGNTTAKKLPENLFLAYAILYLALIVPILNIAAGLALIVVFIALISYMVDSINGLPEPTAEMRAA